MNAEPATSALTRGPAHAQRLLRASSQHWKAAGAAPAGDKETHFNDVSGGADGTRTRDPRRDRPVF